MRFNIRIAALAAAFKKMLGIYKKIYRQKYRATEDEYI